MCHELTELHWMGYSTETTWIRRFKLSTSIPRINSQTYWPKAVSHVTNGTICSICLTSWVTPHFPAAISFFLTESKLTLIRSQKSCSLDSPTVKAKSRLINLVSHESLSMRQTWHMTSNPTIPESTRTEGVSTCIGKPLQENTSKSSMLGSQERSQGNKVKYDPAHTEQRCSSTSIRETNAGRFAFFWTGW